MNINTYTNTVLVAEMDYYDSQVFYWEIQSKQSRGLHKKHCENKLSTFEILYEAAKKEANKRGIHSNKVEASHNK
ncbi:MAG: hypothetical protein JST29_05645 [Bacteroidetes bacterium]|nr:hypothetical protein [Bacteroidota bacterium]